MRSNFHEGRWWMSVARGRGTLLEADDTIVSGEAVRVTCSSWRRRGKKKKKKKTFVEGKGRGGRERRIDAYRKKYIRIHIHFRDNFFLV